MLYVTFPLAALIELLAPVVCAAWLTRRTGKAGWLLVGVGVLTFVGSQVVHLPLNWGLGQIGLLPQDETRMLQIAVVAGLTAGLCEESARAVGYWLLQHRARTWKSALTLGVGHGGIESIVVGGLVLLTFVNMAVLRNQDLATLGLAGDQLALAQQQVAAYWGQPWHIPLAGAVERLTSIVMHLSLAVLVLQAFTRRNVLYYVGAVVWHAAIDALAVILLAIKWDLWAIEGVLALVALANLGLILAFRHSPHDVEAEPVPVPVPVPPLEPKPRDETNALREQIERSRFEG